MDNSFASASSLDDVQPKQIYISKLFVRKEVDEKDETDLRWSSSYKTLQQITSNGTEKEVANALVEKASMNMDMHAEITMGILYGILSEPSQAQSLFQNLQLIVRDNFLFCINQVKPVIFEKFNKLLDGCRAQLLWLMKKFIELNIYDTDELCRLLLRNIFGGDISQRNIWLITNMIQLFEEHKTWLFNNPQLIPLVVYTFLRLIPDHQRQLYETLREREVSLCIELLRKRFPDCMQMGRDLIRLLQDVAKIPEFESLWRDILNKPTSLASNFTNIQQILSSRTPRVYSQSRISPEMESQLMFLMTKVRMGNQKRYQLWFTNKWLNTPESESLIPDIIRFICCYYHPSNQVLSSDILPRWAIIGWLLKCLKTSYMIANAKLALFYDWLFFEIHKDNIMNIEPAMLLMFHSIPKYAALTASLLDFLIGCTEMYDPTRKDYVRQGIYNSLKVILSKGVIGSLQPILFCQAIDQKLMKKMRIIFSPFYRDIEEKKEKEPSKHFVQLSIADDADKDSKKEADVLTSPVKSFDLTPPSSPKIERVRTPTSQETISAPMDISEPLPSLEEHKVPTQLKFDIKVENPPTRMEINTHASSNNVPDLLKSIFDPLISAFEEARSPILLEQLLSSFKDTVKGETESRKIGKHLASYLHSVISSELSESSTESLTVSSGLTYTLFCYAKKIQEKERVLLVVRELQAIEKSIGYRFLCALSVDAGCEKYFTGSELEMHPLEIQGNPFDTFNKYLKSSENPSDVFLDAMKILNEDNLSMFFKMVPLVFRYLEDFAIANKELLHLIVSTIDANQLCSLTCSSFLNEMQLFGTKEASLEWETFEQFSVWQLVHAEFSHKQNEARAFIMKVICALNPDAHREAISGALFLIKEIAPSYELLDELLSLSIGFGKFVASVLNNWSLSGRDILISLLQQVLEKKNKGSENAEVALQHIKNWSSISKTNEVWKNKSLETVIHTLRQKVEGKH